MNRRAHWCAVAGAVLALLAAGPAAAADTHKGKNLYQAQCAICHGSEGRATMPGAPSFDRGEQMLRADMALLTLIRSGKNAMPAFQGRLSDRDIMDVIAYIRTLH